MSLSLGNRIKVLRTQKHLSQKELCGNFINRVVLSRIENGRMLPSFTQLQYISDRLDVPVSSLLGLLDYSEKINNLDAVEHSQLLSLFKKESYIDIIKMNEFKAEEFNNTNDFCKHYFLGMSYFKIGMFKESIKPLRKFINTYSKSERDLQQKYVIDFAIALNTLNKVMVRNKNYIKAQHYLLMAQKYLADFNETNSLINCIIHNNLAFIFSETNEYEKAISIGEAFLSTRGNILYIGIMPNLHKILNIAYYNIANYELSIKHIDKAIQLYLYEDNHQEAAGCYVNFINTLRYARKFEDAFKIVTKCKREYLGFDNIYLKILMQEITLYFNIEAYDKVVELSEQIPVSKLKKLSKCNLNFMLGHIGYANNSFEKAYKLLKSCEKVFRQENFTQDLSLLYSDLYCITNLEIYNTASKQYNYSNCKRNIT
jgi:transcriptional regulator with XRE-family HTH domain